MTAALAAAKLDRGSDEACDESKIPGTEGPASPASMRRKARHATKIYNLRRQVLIQLDEGSGKERGLNREDAVRARR